MGPLAIAWSEGDWLSGSGKLEQCFIGKIILTRKSINERLPFKTIIPSGLHETCSIKNDVISISCTISNIFN
jgi:hypothetical protein